MKLSLAEAPFTLSSGKEINRACSLAPNAHIVIRVPLHCLCIRWCHGIGNNSERTSIGSTMPWCPFPRPSPSFQPIFCSSRLPTLSSLMPCAVGCSNLKNITRTYITNYLNNRLMKIRHKSWLDIMKHVLPRCCGYTSLKV